MKIITHPLIRQQGLYDQIYNIDKNKFQKMWMHFFQCKVIVRCECLKLFQTASQS